VQKSLRPAAFLDRDGVINVDHGYVHSIDKLDWVNGAIPAIRRLRESNYLIIVVTNQSGVARGYYSEKMLNQFHTQMNGILRAEKASIDRFYYCPYHPEANIDHYKHPNHRDRKPNPGMLLRAMEELPIDRERSFLIGDKQSDVHAAANAGVRGHLFDGSDLDLLVKKILRALSLIPST
jgi:D-glycero-D-manno-heptose 1,7-bisphosphate phosphatase